MGDVSSRDVLLQTEELQAATEFYTRGLGMTTFLERPDLVGLDAGSFRLFLEREPVLGPVFEIFVDDLAEAKKNLIGQGCRIEAEDASVPKCYLRDPYGLIFNIAGRRS